MKTSSVVFALDFTDPAILAARKVREVLDQAEGLDRPHLIRIMTQCYGSTAADGRWSLRDAYDVLELAQVLYLTTADLPADPNGLPCRAHRAYCVAPDPHRP